MKRAAKCNKWSFHTNHIFKAQHTSKSKRFYAECRSSTGLKNKKKIRMKNLKFVHFVTDVRIR